VEFAGQSVQPAQELVPYLPAGHAQSVLEVEEEVAV
jgi:hypothetical protein